MMQHSNIGLHHGGAPHSIQIGGHQPQPQMPLMGATTSTTTSGNVYNNNNNNNNNNMMPYTHHHAHSSSINVMNASDTAIPSGQRSGRISPKSTGRRSPNSYYERTTTVRLLQTSTSRYMCTKLCRIQRTRCTVQDSAPLCDDFLNGYCEHSGSCQLVHVPRQYLWSYLSPQLNDSTMIYNEGFNIRCYTPAMDAYYDIPSQYVYFTRGSQRYVELFNDNGDNFKEKCRLCEVLLNTGYCEDGSECEGVHCCTGDMSSFPCIRTHIAEADTVGFYPRLPANMIVRVFQPNSGEEGQDFYGNDVLRTAGAAQYEEEYNKNLMLLNNGGSDAAAAGVSSVPPVKMQHCAHFQTKKMCRLGDGCRFLHVVSMALATPLATDDNNNNMNNPNVSPRSTSPMDVAATSMGSAPRVHKNNAAFQAVAGMISAGASLTDMLTPQSSTMPLPAPMPMRPISLGDAAGGVMNHNHNPHQQQQQMPSSNYPSNMQRQTTTSGAPMQPLQQNHQNHQQQQQQMGACPTCAVPQAQGVAMPAAANNERRSPVRRHNPYAM